MACSPFTGQQLGLWLYPLYSVDLMEPWDGANKSGCPIPYCGASVLELLSRPSLDEELLIFSPIHLTVSILVSSSFSELLTVLTSVILINFLGTWSLCVLQEAMPQLLGGSLRPAEEVPLTLHSHCSYPCGLPGCHTVQCLDIFLGVCATQGAVLGPLVRIYRSGFSHKFFS